MNKINVVVLFGDPNDGSRVGTVDVAKVKVFCHEGDNICDGGILVTSDHRNVSSPRNPSLYLNFWGGCTMRWLRLNIVFN